MNPASLVFLVILLAEGRRSPAAETPSSGFRTVEIDSAIQIGYGVTVADVDGDKKPDIVLADKSQIVWYRNPGWDKYVLAENLTKLDNVCVAAADIDGDGKAEIAVGAGWNPNDTINSGAVFYLIAPKDRTQKWEAVELPHEPTVHRMRWVTESPGKAGLVVVPLHGRENKNGEGAGVKILAYHVPPDPHQPWKAEPVNVSLHMTHNFDTRWNKQPAELLVAAREGVFRFQKSESGWNERLLIGKTQVGPTFAGAGEVRSGKLPGGRTFMATVEPMHGNQLVVYTAGEDKADTGDWKRTVLDSSLKEGHALACGDLLGTGSDQVIVGWRGKNSEGKTGIKMFTSIDPHGDAWRHMIVDDNTMACEDLCLADLNGDGKLDIIASGRATKNVKIYFNENSGRP